MKGSHNKMDFSNFRSQPTVDCEINLVDPKIKTKRRKGGRKEGRENNLNIAGHLLFYKMCIFMGYIEP